MSLREGHVLRLAALVQEAHASADLFVEGRGVDALPIALRHLPQTKNSDPVLVKVGSGEGSGQRRENRMGVCCAGDFE